MSPAGTTGLAGTRAVPGSLRVLRGSATRSAAPYRQPWRQPLPHRAPHRALAGVLPAEAVVAEAVVAGKTAGLGITSSVTNEVCDNLHRDLRQTRLPATNDFRESGRNLHTPTGSNRTFS